MIPYYYQSCSILLFEWWLQIAVVFFVRHSFDIVIILDGGCYMLVSVNDGLVFLSNIIISSMTPASCLFLSWSKIVVFCIYSFHFVIMSYAKTSFPNETRYTENEPLIFNASMQYEIISHPGLLQQTILFYTLHLCTLQLAISILL